MSDLKQARALLEAGAKDVSALRGMGDEALFADEIFGFHVQQAAEKLLKAWLASLGEIYPLSHDLASLLDMLRKRGADVARFDGPGGLHRICRSLALHVRRHGFTAA